jgi:hypothetical protein
MGSFKMDWRIPLFKAYRDEEDTESSIMIKVYFPPIHLTHFYRTTFEYKIGNGAIFGSNSLVLKDVEPWSINIGSPCKNVGEIPKIMEEDI